MNDPRGQDQDDATEGPTVVGFEVPRSPGASYNNPRPGGIEDEARDPPLVPPHLQHTLLSVPPRRDGSSSLPSPPQNVTLNHLYVDNIDRSAVSLGITHRYRSKYVSMVVYKPVQRR